MVKLEQRLKEERIKRGLTIEEAAAATKIKPHFLEAIERGAYQELPSPAYAKGFVRNYADFLELPKTLSSALFKRDFDEKRAVKVLPDGMVKKDKFPIKRLNLRQIVIGLGGVSLVILFILYQVRGILFPPSITLSSPKDESLVSREVNVAGKTDSKATITINQQPVFVNTDGNFEKKISLFPGKSTIIIKAKNRFGKESTLQRVVIVE